MSSLASADHACALWRKFAHQGWLYISENFLCFYSYLLGVEIKLLVELKDIRSLTKEKVAGGLLANSIRIATIDGKEVRCGHGHEQGNEDLTRAGGTAAVGGAFAICSRLLSTFS